MADVDEYLVRKALDSSLPGDVRDDALRSAFIFKEACGGHGYWVGVSSSLVQGILPAHAEVRLRAMLTDTQELASQLEDADQVTQDAVGHVKAAWEGDLARIAAAVFEPVVLPDGCPSIVDRILSQIEELHRTVTDLKTENHELYTELMRRSDDI